ncbi:hypothetical protein G4B88_029200 [Cannabis sativa]|uniref:Ubiquitin-like protease family profile domain-containing protein n=1 Tax=Cannabis sativa TaxID=3483 RepID=A0A7J6H2L9_CANSA|nr:hypothetical protein G4B88_029200 [Cannabis sativa]
MMMNSLVLLESRPVVVVEKSTTEFTDSTILSNELSSMSNQSTQFNLCEPSSIIISDTHKGKEKKKALSSIIMYMLIQLNKVKIGISKAVSKILEYLALRAVEHWMVILIQTGSQSVVFLDSRNKTIRQDIKRCVQTALERYYLEKRNRRSIAISFTEYRCPEQPDGVQCRYYSMRFIKSFMTENNPTRKLETENISSSYTNKEINEIRDEWAKRYSTKDCKIVLNV